MPRRKSKSNRSAEQKIERALKEGAAVLNLNNMYLTELPETLGQLANLYVLNLSDNQLTALPETLGQLTQLHTLALYSNQLTTLPETLGKLTQLKTLVLFNNQLTTLTETLGKLTQLTRLDLQNNQLTTLPETLGKLTQLKTLYLRGNPMNDPPPSVVEQGTRAVLAYLREMKQATAHKWESKLLIVGEAGVGKSELVNSLLGDDFETTTPTQGVEIRTLPLQHPSEDSVTMTLNLWDFGGQAIQHATH
jgi:Leucine-rich repeat (LRR) protein